MRNILLLLAATVLWSCKNNDNTLKPLTRDSLPSLYEGYTNQWLAFNPIAATVFGFPGYNDQLPIDISETYRERYRKFLREYKDKLSRVDMKGLTHEDSLNLALLNWDIDIALQGLQFNDHLMPLNQFQSLHIFLAQFGSGQGPQPFQTMKDHENWLSRAGKFPAWADTAISNMRRGMRMGWVQPKAIVEKTLPQLQGFAETPLEQNVFYMPVAALASSKQLSDTDKAVLKGKYEVLVNNQLRPAFARLYKFMKEEYLPAARTTSGIGALPGGKDYYQWLVRYYTTTDMTPEQIFELGQSEVARIRKEMEQVREQVGFKGDLKAFFKFVMENDSLRPYKDPSQVLARFGEIHKQLQPELAKQFDMVPKTSFEIRRTEAFREASASAEYMPGDLASGRPGIFYVPIPNVKRYNVFQDEALFLHEAIPGHHYQIAIQKEKKDVPSFRQFSYYGAYMEGWGLYAESLGREMGLYKDPYQYFGRLGMEMHRALRLVLDVGLHVKGWSREQAIAYDLDNEAESEANVIAEVERYMVIPGQALSYKVGEQRILALKAMARKEMGSRFDVRQFHNEVLKDGAVPLDVLSSKVKTLYQQKP